MMDIILQANPRKAKIFTYNSGAKNFSLGENL